MQLLEGSDRGPATEDGLLLRRVANGEVAGPMSELYARYGRRLYGFGLRILGDPGMAEELVQETFVRVWRSAGRFDPARGAPSTFMFAIARHTAIDLLRRPASRPLASGAGDDPALLREGAVDERLEHVALALDVRGALGALSAKHREVLELLVDEDLSQPEVAERLGIPLGTVKTRAYYGLRALKLELEERGLA